MNKKSGTSKASATKLVKTIIREREKIKKLTIQQRRLQHQKQAA
jgi:hypothetical protein